MTKSEQKIVRYLGEAHGSERSLVQVLEAQIAITPRGGFRVLLEAHLAATKDHAERVQRRVEELAGRGGFNPVAIGVNVAGSVLGQVLAVAKTPFDLARGSGGAEKVLKNAKDDCAAEALEIATYTALGHLADSIGDTQTAKLSASILADEEKMLKRLLEEIPRLAEAAMNDSVGGSGTYDVTKTGAADAVRGAARKVETTVERGAEETRRAARQARRVPGVARVEGDVKGVLASESDLAIQRYDQLTAAEINEKLRSLSQIDLAKTGAYERKNQNRTTITSRITALTGTEPWPGYDEQTVDEIKGALAKIDDADELKTVRDYEQAHKARITVISATERELAHAGG
jgi:ferritin-like metal-binding protein YciE